MKNKYQEPMFVFILTNHDIMSASTGYTDPDLSNDNNIEDKIIT